MSVHPINPRSRTFAVIGSIVTSLAFTGVASASEPTVTLVQGNPDCASLGAGYSEVKLEPVRRGRTIFGDGTLSGSIVVDGLYFSWSATPGVDAVIVKGGSNANVYQADDEMTSGTGLHAPLNDDGRPYGLSHISFCTDGVDSPQKRTAPSTAEPGTSPGPCEPGGSTTMADGQPCAAPAGGTETQSSNGQVEVLGTVITRRATATATFNAPSACVKRSFVPVVRGKGIRKVILSVNGKRIRTISGARSRYAATVDPKLFSSGVMRLKARVVFVAASGRRAQTFRMTVLRCQSAAVNTGPSFAG